MWRTRAVITMLIEEVAGLDLPATSDGLDPSPDWSTARNVLSAAGRRARLVVIVDLIAIVVLFLLQESSQPFLPVHRSVDTVFTLGVLAVAAHAGFRTAQLLGYRTVARLCAELRQREDP